MAIKRCIPTNFFRHPDIANLSKESQLILLGLVLSGDDEGRGVADARLLGREIDYPPEQIEASLLELQEACVITLYQVGRHRYYQIVEDWQKSMGTKRTRSKLPAPPETSNVPRENADVPPETSELPPESTDVPPESTSQFNLIESNITEEEEKQTSNITPFPTTTRSDSGSAVSLDEKTIETTTQKVATILRLPVSAALQRVVADFLGNPAISLQGEADAAREYIDSPARNHRHKTMSPAFYRQWLKRERDQTKAHTPTGTNNQGTETPPATRTRSYQLPGRNLSNLAAEYEAAAQAPTKKRKSELSPGGAHGH